ncbi:MAG TPA: serine hydrolase [Longimicrobium sp.]|jgi:CubicO group peptidase (beta-lactamase class C family)
MSPRPTFLSARTAILVAAALLAPGAAHAQTGALPPELDAYIAKALAEWEVPGMALAVVRHDSVLVARGYGVRELGKPGRVDENTVFDIASLTKSFTAAGAAVLVDEGKLAWDDPVRRWLPWMEFPDAYLTREVTLRDLLSHRTGLEAANFAYRFTGIDRGETLRQVRWMRPQAPFRTRQVYNNILYAAAGEVTAAAAGTTWAELMRTRLFQPLGMGSTTAEEEPDRAGNVASPHAPIGGVQRPVRARNHQAISPAGGVYSTAADMARWLRFQLADGVLDGRRVISAAAMAEMHHPWTVIPTTPEMRASRQVEGYAGYGLGWNVMDYRGRPLLWHSGNSDGMPSYMAILPKDGIGVVVMLNSWGASVLHGELVSRVLDTLLGLPTRDYSGELMARTHEAERRAREAAAREDSARVRGTRPTLPLDAYAGVYADSLYGEIAVAREGEKLTLRMGKGEIADLEHWHHDTFRVLWRDDLFREYFSTLVTFSLDARPAPAMLGMRLNRDWIEARRRAAP